MRHRKGKGLPERQKLIRILWHRKLSAFLLKVGADVTLLVVRPNAAGAELRRRSNAENAYILDEAEHDEDSASADEVDNEVDGE
ncbi:hypothetical protein OC835_006835, partial [Tilletia horrida]